MSFLAKIIPANLRAQIRRSEYWRRIEAKRLAKGWKRLDLCAADIAHLLHVAEVRSIEGGVCLELGCGWVLSHALIFYLLGAKRVIATDVAPLAMPTVLTQAICSSVSSTVRDVLSPFSDHAQIRARLDKVLSVGRWSFGALDNLGIKYIAPVDLAQTPLGIPLDCVYSLSVLEHVPVIDIAPLLSHLAKDLRCGGIMINAIHLEDHTGIACDPFGFLAENQESLTKRRLGGHFGENRIRGSQWRSIFDAIGDLDSRFIYEWKRLDKQLPSKIDPSVIYEDESDLRTSHIAVLSIKR